MFLSDGEPFHSTAEFVQERANYYKLKLTYCPLSFNWWPTSEDNGRCSNPKCDQTRFLRFSYEGSRGCTQGND